MAHAIDWFEIPVADFARARKFYETIFVCSMPEMQVGQGLRMALFPANPREEVGGALCHLPEFYRPTPDGALLYLNGNPDLAPILGRVEPAGGKILVPKRQISPEHGFMAIFHDTEGNRLGLHSRR